MDLVDRMFETLVKQTNLTFSEKELVKEIMQLLYDEASDDWYMQGYHDGIHETAPDDYEDGYFNGWDDGYAKAKKEQELKQRENQITNKGA